MSSLSVDQLVKICTDLENKEIHPRLRGKIKLADIMHEVRKIPKYAQSDRDTIINLIMKSLAEVDAGTIENEKHKTTLFNFAQRISEMSEIQSRVKLATRIAFRKTIDTLGEEKSRSVYNAVSESLRSLKRSLWGDKKTQYNERVEYGISEFLKNFEKIKASSPLDQRIELGELFWTSEDDEGYAWQDNDKRYNQMLCFK